MNLFQDLNAATRQELETFEQILRHTLKPKAAHLKNLPDDIAELSYILTEGRDELARPYWSEARLKAAYLWYFLPWNLVRLTPLLAGLPLELKAGDSILDLGSGPLTFPIALWLARPDLREVSLTFYCNDMHLVPLQSGLALFNTMSKGLAGEAPAWQIKFHKGSVKDALQKAKQNKPKLIAALNVLNEIRPERRQSLARMLEATVSGLRSALAPEGSLLIIEPGNRLGGKIVELTRETAIKQKLFAVTPCPHRRACPMLSPSLKTWCHFVNENPQAPAWLGKLSNTAGLAKTHIALSFVLLNAKENNRAETEPDPKQNMQGRVISNPFTVPGQPGMCRYACTASGLVLLIKAGKLGSGSLTGIKLDENTDSKSGARIANPI